MTVNVRKYCLLTLLLIILISCSAKVSMEDLIGGYWEVTSENQEGEPSEENSCVLTAFHGLEFKDEGIVYIEGFESDFKYWLEDSGSEIHFAGDEFGLYLIYEIEEMSDNEIVLTSEKNRDSKVESCYLERQ